MQHFLQKKKNLTLISILLKNTKTLILIYLYKKNKPV